MASIRKEIVIEAPASSMWIDVGLATTKKTLER
jgi:hypothetical protein